MTCNEVELKRLKTRLAEADIQHYAIIKTASLQVHCLPDSNYIYKPATYIACLTASNVRFRKKERTKKIIIGSAIQNCNGCGQIS